MSEKLAVLFVHGVETSDDDVAATAVRLLREEFTAHTGIAAHEALVVRSANWVPVLQRRQDDLERRPVCRPRSRRPAPSGSGSTRSTWTPRCACRTPASRTSCANGAACDARDRGDARGGVGDVSIVQWVDHRSGPPTRYPVQASR